MKTGRWMMTGCGIVALGLCHCGGDKPTPEPLPEGEGPLDPYRAPMSVRINTVLYGRGKPEEMLAQLALLGVGPGKNFEDFKEESGIDDWFEIETSDGRMRQVSLTCGLSPVVDDNGNITTIYRSRKRIDDRLHEELRITPE
jgi:hypothetical protein